MLPSRKLPIDFRSSFGNMYSYFHSQTFPQVVFHYGCINTHHRRRHPRNFERCKKISRILCCQNSETLGNGKSKTLSFASEKPRNSFQVNFMKTTMNAGHGTSSLQAEGRKVFLLIKAIDKVAAMEILKAQSLRQQGVESFVIRNLIPNVGDVIELYLRMDNNTEIELTKEVYLIVDSASSATFDKRYDVALKEYTKLPSHVLSIAQKSQNIHIFPYISTGHVRGGEAQEIIKEKAFCMRVIRMARERISLESLQFSGFEMKLASESAALVNLNIETALQKMRDLSLERSSDRIRSSICRPNMETQVLEKPRGNFTVMEVVDNGRANTGTALTAVAPSVMKPGGGIGIVNFLKRKNYFITGATGLVGKVFIEKLLRTAPDVGKIYLLTKAKDKEAALQRLNTEIIESELFKKLQEVHGKSYKAFMRRKLIPVVGNVCESNLGMDAHSANLIAREVDVIINSAANTTFDERYDVALNTNTKGPSRLLSFAKTCKKIAILVHMSTAYVSNETQGLIKEQPHYMGEGIGGEQTSRPLLDIDFELELASNFVQSINVKEANQKMKALGLYRANIHGWQNTYAFTKAMGEMIISSTRGDIPIVIVRPTVIESTYQEPFPGWIQGNRMLDPLILSYGKGQLPGFIADPNAIVDVVPVDMVVNASIAAMAKHGAAMKHDLNVYHVASSVINPITFGDVFEYSYEHFRSFPLLDSKVDENGILGMKFFSKMDNFLNFISNEMAKNSGLVLKGANGLEPKLHSRLERKCMKKAEHFVQMAKVYEPYMFYKGRFDNGNIQKLMVEMSNEEMRNFGFDVATIDWKQYMCSIHIPGLRKHVLKKEHVVSQV